MGAWGYGVYESDNSLDTLQNIFEYIDVNYQELKLKDGKVIDTLWSPNEGLLDDKIIKKILRNLKGLEEDVLKSDFKDSEEENEHPQNIVDGEETSKVQEVEVKEIYY